jgi:hypothetical protein
MKFDLARCCGALLGQGAGLALGTVSRRPRSSSPFFILGVFVRIAESNHLHPAVTQESYGIFS